VGFEGGDGADDDCRSRGVILNDDDAGTFDSVNPGLRISQSNYGRLAEFVTSELGIKMPESKVTMIQSRLAHRVRDLGLESLDDYCEHLFSPAGAATEHVHFMNAVTTNKTDFFREPQHFDCLTRTVLPQLLASPRCARDRSIGVWSAACSSGEEPYTLAIVLSEYASGHPPFEFRILATDISTSVLQTARDGIYSRHLIEPVPPALRRKYFLQSKSGKGSVRIKATLRRSVSFHQLNFMDDDYCVREMFDVIFCRNVLIYFDRATQQAVIGKLCRNLNPGGFLFVSHTEFLSGLDLPLESLGSSCFKKHGE
jgi:chemotaxis protein methyltransferase CheR